MKGKKNMKWIQCSRLITFEYIKLNGKLIAIDSNQTKIIFTVTRFRVLFLPNRIG